MDMLYAYISMLSMHQKVIWWISTLNRFLWCFLSPNVNVSKESQSYQESTTSVQRWVTETMALKQALQEEADQQWSRMGSWKFCR